MDTSKLKKFAAFARRTLIEQVSNRLKLVLADNSAARREQPQAIKALESALKQSSQEALIERVAYVWFNRFCALRFMDVNRYTRIGVVSPVVGQFQPEILAEAKMGHIDDDLADATTREKICGLLDGKVPSSDPQAEAYRLLMVAACNDWHRAMPYLFEKINDYTELLMPDDLLSGNSILAYTREAMTPDVCGVTSDQWPVASKENTSHQSLATSHSAAGGVEVIGWLYQFYISEKKDEVFEGLKKNKKITPENIPAATQLFTPHWIVRYLVENSLGRLWMLNRPNSRLIDQMEYYIKPEEPETDFLKITSPEEIKICDPACGSGHMLTYAFDLLYAIYEESGYEPNEIPAKILTHNLYGIEIDERAGELAAFALTMKARAKQRRFFRQPVQPNICVLENIVLGEDTLKNYARVFGKELFSDTVIETLQQFREAKNFGSLIIPKTSQAAETLAGLQQLKERSLVGMGSVDELPQEQQLLVSTPNFDAICKALQQADYLRPKYHVVIANPPYMGGKGMNGRMAVWAKDNYPDSKSDLFAMFIERGLNLIPNLGFSAMVTMESWMFLSSYEKLRSTLREISTLDCMVHMPYLGKGGTSMGINFGTCASVFNKARRPNFNGQFCCVRYFETDKQGVPLYFPPRNERLCKASADDFNKIPGSPIAYWVCEKEKNLYSKCQLLGEVSYPRKGLDTGENDIFLRLWNEVSSIKTCLDNKDHTKRWYPYNKGGDFRRWYGNREFLINWEHDGVEIKQRTDWSSKKPTIRNASFYFRKGFTWTTVSSGGFSARYCPDGALFDNGGCTIFADSNLDTIGAFINTKIMSRYLEFLSPTLNFQPGDISRALFPYDCLKVTTKSNECVNISKSDWDSYETSWDFTELPLLSGKWEVRSEKQEKLSTLHSPLSTVYAKLRSHWQATIIEIQRLEEENNRIFIEAYGLQDELTPEVPLKEITLTCNPHYRYGGNKSDAELEALLLADTMKELISYAVGCMFGRYALEKPGLILANQGETLEDYLKQIPNPSFPADKDNVIPILDGDWFTDDITDRFRKFLRLTFGEEHYSENLKFIEDAIGKDLRKYFLKDFYSDHVKRYKKRPIYWLFSSPKGSFNALIYMHRYQPDTVSIVLNDYLREFKTKLSAQLEHLKRVEASTEATKAEKTKALKEIENLRKTLDELDTWERDVLYPLATQKIEIDLDNGVKHNYTLFGSALKKIPGLDAKED